MLYGYLRWSKRSEESERDELVLLHCAASLETKVW